jgi:hypothetical protein
MPVTNIIFEQIREDWKMARITLRQLLDHAAEYSYGVPAFNINNIEQVIAIMDAASEVDAPLNPIPKILL